MTKNTIKNIIMSVAIFLAVSLAAGWIAQTVINKQKQETLPESPTAGNFIVEPESNNLMRLTAMPLSTNDGISTQAEESFVITATALDENGDKLAEQQLFDWSMAWASSAAGNITNYVTMITNGNKATFTCKQAFTTQIIVTCASKLNSSATATATLDYYRRVAEVKMKLGNDAEKSIKGSPTISTDFPSNYGNGITNADWMTKNLNWGKTVEWGAGTMDNSYNAIRFEFVPSEELKAAYKGGYGSIQTFNAAIGGGVTLQSVDSYAHFCAAAVSGATIDSLIGQSSLYYLLQAYSTTDNQYTVNVTVHPKYGDPQTYSYTLNIEVAATQVKNVNIDNSSHVF